MYSEGHYCSLRTNLVSFRTLFPPNQLCPGLFYRNLQQDGSRYEIPTVILPHSASISTMYSLFKSSKGLLLQNFCQTCLVLLMNSGVKVTCPKYTVSSSKKSWKKNVFKKVIKDFLLILLFEHTELGRFF